MLVNTAMFLFTINNTFGKEVMNLDIGKTTFTEFTLFRSVFMMNSSLLMMYGDRRSIYDVPVEYRWILFSRCTIGTFAFLITTVGLKMLPLSIFVMIMNTTPFITAIL